MRYLHTMVRVSDLDHALDFYCAKLGLEEVSRIDNPAGRFTLVFLAAPDDVTDAELNRAPTVELTHNWDPEPYAGGRNFGHLAYQVDDIYETCRRLMEGGVTVNRPPRDGRMAFVRSPDGISIEPAAKGERIAPDRAMGVHAKYRGLVSHGPAGRPFRVALVTSSYNFIADGVALTLNRLVGFLESRGVEVLVFAPVSKTPAFAHQGEIVAVPSAPLPLRSEYRLTLGLPRAQRERLRAFDPDIVHIAVPDLLGYQALRFALRLGRPVVASYHTRYETYLKYYGLDMFRGPAAWIISRFYASCREVYVPSHSMADVLGREISRDNIHLWQRGVDTARFNPAKRSEAWRASVGLRPDEVAVTFVSRLVREKRVATVVEVLKRLSAAGIPHRGLFVGEGPERAALQNAAPGAVFTGHLGGEDLAAAYASSDIFIFPSDTETFGSVTLEAMASGLPTVCADATGSRSLVESGVTGYLLDPRDDAGFFGHVRDLVIDQERRTTMGRAARERSLRFSWDEAMGGLLARYEALAGDFNTASFRSLVAA